jgi:hypothetical protein
MIILEPLVTLLIFCHGLEGPDIYDTVPMLGTCVFDEIFWCFDGCQSRSTPKDEIVELR